MTTLAEWLRRVWYLINRRRMEEELKREMEAHREMMVEPPRFGNSLRLREEARDVWGWNWLDDLLQDLRYAFRMMRKAPTFTAVVVLTLALGIGANTTIFSLIDTIMWRMLPVKDPEGLLFLTKSDSSALGNGFTYRQYRFLRDENQVLSGLAAYSPVRFNVSVDGSIEPAAEGQLVSGSYFAVLGVNPFAGRAITVEDDRVPNGHPVAIFCWHDRQRGGRSLRCALQSEPAGRDCCASCWLKACCSECLAVFVEWCWRAGAPNFW
jgi:hypothetical protein